MSEISVFIFPEDKTATLEFFSEKVEDALTELKVTEGIYENEEDWLAPGENSAAPFVDKSNNLEGDDIGFEYCVVYAAPEKYLIPDVPGAFPRCPHCDADVEEEYYTLFGDEDEFDEENQNDLLDFAQMKLNCPSCGKESELDSLKDKTGIFLRSQYLNFEECCGEISEAWVKELSDKLGLKLTSRTYYYEDEQEAEDVDFAEQN